jgi:F-type H+-transporting ATPase subunit a
LELTPDLTIYFRIGDFVVNATILYTWIIMILLGVGSWLVTRRLTTDVNISRGQNLLEVLVDGMRTQIREISGGQDPDLYLPYIGTLFVFIATANILIIIPFYEPPTASLSTTAGLAITVLIMVPVFGVIKVGFLNYLRHYLKPTPLMLPFKIIGEFSRTLALAARLFGNIMSGSLIVALLLALIPFFIPVVMVFLGLITGMVQAYIFPILAMVYISSGMTSWEKVRKKLKSRKRLLSVQREKKKLQKR